MGEQDSDVQMMEVEVNVRENLPHFKWPQHDSEDSEACCDELLLIGNLAMRLREWAQFRVNTPLKAIHLGSTVKMIETEYLSEFGGTFLHEVVSAASRGGKVEKELFVFQNLITLGLDPNFRDNLGKTPLHVAAEKGAPEKFVEALINAGADVMVKARNGRTPLDMVPKFIESMSPSAEAARRKHVKRQGLFTTEPPSFAKLAALEIWSAVLNRVRRHDGLKTSDWDEEYEGKTALMWCNHHGSSDIAKELEYFKANRSLKSPPLCRNLFATPPARVPLSQISTTSLAPIGFQFKPRTPRTARAAPSSNGNRPSSWMDRKDPDYRPSSSMGRAPRKRAAAEVLEEEEPFPRYNLRACNAKKPKGLFPP